MAELGSLPESERRTKTEFVVQQAQARLDATVSAYDALSSKAFTLLTIAVPLLAGLAGYAVFQADLASPLFYASVVYAGTLVACVVPLWLVVRVQPMTAPGRKPSEYANPEVGTWSHQKLLDEECGWYETGITDNEREVIRASRRLRLAMTLFLLAPAVSLVLLGVGSSIKFAERLQATGPACRVSRAEIWEPSRGLGR